MSRRGDIADRTLLACAAAAGALALAWLALLGTLPEAFHAPGSPLLYSSAVAGSALLLVPLAFAVAKRRGGGGALPRWLAVHALAALAGTVLVAVHTAGRLTDWPALLLVVLLALMALGLWARVAGARRMADTFGCKPRGFAPPAPSTREALERIVAAKRCLLAALDPPAAEATFAPAARHWLAHPLLTSRYLRLARAEAAVMGQRTSVPPAQAWWRALHLALAALFLLGLAVHVVLVTFFAAWVAEGGEVYWWHASAWGG